MPSPCSRKSGSDQEDVELKVPESIASFVHEGAIRRAVREVLKIPGDRVLEGLDWSELERFYRAQLAARQLEAEWAIFGLSAWTAIWADLLTDWTALTPDEQEEGDYDAKLGVSSLRDTLDESLWFGRVLRKGSWTLWASVAAIPSVGLSIRIACQNAARSVGFGLIAPSADEVGNWTPSTTLILNEGDVDPAPLREVAQRAIEIALGTISPIKRPKA